MHYDVFHAHAQDFGGDLRQDGIRASADVGSAHHHVKGAIIIQFDGRPTHVESGDGGPMHCQSNTDAAPETPIATFTALLLPAKLLFDDVQTLGQATAFNDLGKTL